MKLLNQFSVMAAIVSTLTFASCADDVYDPEKVIPTEPKENPLGEDFSAPNGFTWSMINSVNLTVEVKDEFKGRYNYLIEVFTSNPLSDTTITPIAAGSAKQGSNYTVNINIPKVNERIFIRQTDPKQRKEVYEYTIPQNGGALNCKLYYIAHNTRAVGSSTSAFEAAQAKGFVEPEHIVYKEAEVFANLPESSSEPNNDWGSGMTFDNGAKFIITSEYDEEKPFTKDMQISNGRMSIYVKGVWKPQNINYAFDIYVLDGGKIITPTNLTLGSQTNLFIQSKGTVEVQNEFNIQCKSTKNFGTITARSIKMDQTKQELYNESIIKADNTLYLNGVKVLNYNTLNAKEVYFTDINLLNKLHIKSQTGILLNGGVIFNYGDITFNETDGYLKSNNSTNTAVINHYEATIKGFYWSGGISIYNDGFIEVSNCTNSSTDILYNSCTFVIKNEFTFENIILDKGSITGGRASISAKEWLPIPSVHCIMPIKFTLKNGSMIKANQFTLDNSVNSIVGEGDDKSMIKTNTLTLKNGGRTNMTGNLVFECNSVEGNANTLYKDASVVSTGYDESQYTIETCGGIFNEGNEGSNEGDIQYPTEIIDKQIYTFAFEDNWPGYGDFDMNDLIIVMTQKALKIDKSGAVTHIEINLNLRAVGATKTLGAGICFTKLPANLQPTKLILSDNNISFETGQATATLLLFNDAHKELWAKEFNEKEKRINTLTNSVTFKKDTKEYTIIMDIPATANVKVEDLNISNIDIFAITTPATEKTKRTEVHQVDFAPTNLANSKQFGTGDDNSILTGKYYLSRDNLAWAIVIPDEFAWPIESQKITNVYDKFASWVTTGGSQSNDWYNSHNNNVYPIENLSHLKD